MKGQDNTNEISQLCVIIHGSYQLDCTIAFVALAADQSRYADWCSGKMGYVVKSLGTIKQQSARAIVKKFILGDYNGSSYPNRLTSDFYTSEEGAAYIITHEQAQEFLAAEAAAENVILVAKDTQKVEQQTKTDAVFEKARQTGQKQVLLTYMDDCDDPREECSTDFITVYAMPDGSRTTKRQHTW